MKIFVLNCGSSSIKFQFINTDSGEVMAKGLVERIGEDMGIYTYKSEPYTKKNLNVLIEDHAKGIDFILKDLLHTEHGVIGLVSEIDGVGHRVVHGGENYSESVVVDEDVKSAIRDCFDIAPLHNPANMMGVEAVENVLTGVRQVAVFDTAFHQTMPNKAYLYGLPLKYYTQHKIRKYGFHGTSHKFVAGRVSEHERRMLRSMKIITCHIGNGASVTAINHGKSVDTSMGFTPLAGVLMGTRSGNIDPAIPLFMIENMGMSVSEVQNTLNKQGGILGLSEYSNDMREIEDKILHEHDQKIATAFDVYCYRIKKYIGAYAAAMNGVDIIVFTGGVGENMPILREMVCTDMEYLGVKVDVKKNNTRVDDVLEFSTDDSKVKLLKIATNEELMIALETEELLSK